MIPPWLEALILGVVQGLTEFIPVSSSGHLVLVPYLGGFTERGLAFDVLLHVGTLGAVLLYFRGELWAMARGLLRLDTSEQGRIYRRVGLYLVPASIPVAVVGLTLEERVAEAFESPLASSLLLLGTAAILLSLEAVRTRRTRVTGRLDAPAPVDTSRLPLGVDPQDPLGIDLSGLRLPQAMAAGLLQCLALLPGISRSGATIAGGVFAGLTREAATRFSFLLSIPALLGATALSLPDLATQGDDPVSVLTVGVLAAFVSGYVAIRYLVRLVSRTQLTGFAYYCMAAAAVGLVGYAMLGPPGTA